MDLSTLPETIATLAGIGASLIAAIGGWRKALIAQAAADSAQATAVQSAAEAATATRRTAALERAIAYHDGHNQGVRLIMHFPTAEVDARELLQVWGWRVCIYPVDEGVVPRLPEFWDDLKAADCVLVQGSTVPQNAELFKLPEFRERLAGGVSVVSLTPKAGIWYDQTLFRPWDQSVTTAVTAEAAVRGGMERRERVKKIQGVRPGGIAAEKAAMGLG